MGIAVSRRVVGMSLAIVLTVASLVFVAPPAGAAPPDPLVLVSVDVTCSDEGVYVFSTTLELQDGKGKWATLERRTQFDSAGWVNQGTVRVERATGTVDEVATSVGDTTFQDSYRVVPKKGDPGAWVDSAVVTAPGDCIAAP